MPLKIEQYNLLIISKIKIINTLYTALQGIIYPVIRADITHLP